MTRQKRPLAKALQMHAAGGILLIQSGCGGAQSALDPAGPQAEKLATLFWWMTIGSAIIWLGMVVLTIYASKAASDRFRAESRSRMMIVIGGVVVPTGILAVLLAHGLSMLPSMVAPAPEGSLKIAVAGEQWWWRVRYLRNREAIELANEIRIPVGEPVQFELTSSNVIHAFWIPSLGGKRDMIPGRTTHLTLTASRTGFLRGVCAEYCGSSHALMSFVVNVMEKEAFSRWLDEQAREARTPETPRARRGESLFFQNGCGACHQVRGTEAEGVIAPDLTHFGSRYSLAAGVFTNDATALMGWLAKPDRFKPGVHMPAFGMLRIEDREALAAYLLELK